MPPPPSFESLSPSVMLIYCLFFSLCSTTAGSVARLFVENVVLNAPRTQSWALSSLCGCVTPALIPSKKKSESKFWCSRSHFTQIFSILRANLIESCLCVCVCVAVEQHWPRSTRGNTTLPTWTWTHPEAWWSLVEATALLRSTTVLWNQLIRACIQAASDAHWTHWN